MNTHIDFNYVFPPAVARYIDEISSNYKIPSDFLSVSVLSVLATAAGRHFKVSEGRYVNPLVLWFVIVAPSGSNKTFALKLPVEPLRKIDKRLFEQYRDDYQKYLDTVGRKPSGGSSDDRNSVEPPICKSILVDDCTDEKRNEILFHSDSPLLSVYPEFGGFFGDRSRYSADTSSAISRLLKLFDGDQIKIDRKSGATMLIQNPRFNILGDIQPELLVKEFGRETFLRNGLNQRFLFAFADRTMFPPRTLALPDPKIIADWDSIVAEIYNGFSTQTLFPASTVVLSPEADELYTSFFNACQEQKALSPSSYMISIHSKLQIHVLRLAGVLHAAWVQAEPRRDPTTIAPDIIERAWALAEYFEDMALRVGQLLGVDKESKSANELIEPVNLSNRSLLAHVVARFKVRPSELVKLCGLNRSYVTRINNQINENLSADTPPSDDGLQTAMQLQHPSINDVSS